MSANKATNGYMIPRGLEPYTAFRPYEEIDIPLAPSAILQRGTPSVLTHMLGYKVLIELKRSCFELLTGINWNEKQRQDRPYMDVHTKIRPILTNESAIMESYSQDMIDNANRKLDILEATYDIIKTDDGKYEASKEYSKGDIILAGMNFNEKLNRAILETHLTPWQEGYTPNIDYDEDLNAYVARDFIYFGERFVI